jgi:hypothetical protein
MKQLDQLVFANHMIKQADHSTRNEILGGTTLGTGGALGGAYGGMVQGMRYGARKTMKQMFGSGDITREAPTSTAADITLAGGGDADAIGRLPARKVFGVIDLLVNMFKYSERGLGIGLGLGGLAGGTAGVELAKHFSQRKSARTCLYMSKQADIGSTAANFVGGDTGFEHAMGALSYVPMVGFAGNLGQGASQLIRGHPWKALGNLGMGVGSFFTGGAANDAIKGTMGAGRTALGAAKSMTPFTKGYNAFKNTMGAPARAVMGTKPFQSQLGQAFTKHYPQWVSGGFGGGRFGTAAGGFKNPRNYVGMAKNQIGTSAVRSFTNSRDYTGTGMDVKDKMFDTLGSVGSMAPKFMGQGADPRWLTPPATGGAFSPMFQ